MLTVDYKYSDDETLVIRLVEKDLNSTLKVLESILNLINKSSYKKDITTQVISKINFF